MRHEIQCILVRSFLPPKVITIDNYEEELKKFVGDNLEAIPASCEDDNCIILRGLTANLRTPLETNRSWKDQENNILDVICGPFLIVGKKTKNGYYSSLTEEEIEKYLKIYKNPELFWKDCSGNMRNFEILSA